MRDTSRTKVGRLTEAAKNHDLEFAPLKERQGTVAKDVTDLLNGRSRDLEEIQWLTEELDASLVEVQQLQKEVDGFEVTHSAV